MKKEPAPESGALLSIGQVVTVVIGYPDSGSGDDLSRYSRRIVGAIGRSARMIAEPSVNTTSFYFVKAAIEGKPSAF